MNTRRNIPTNPPSSAVEQVKALGGWFRQIRSCLLMVAPGITTGRQDSTAGHRLPPKELASQAVTCKVIGGGGGDKGNPRGGGGTNSLKLGTNPETTAAPAHFFNIFFYIFLYFFFLGGGGGMDTPWIDYLPIYKLRPPLFMEALGQPLQIVTYR